MAAEEILFSNDDSSRQARHERQRGSASLGRRGREARERAGWWTLVSQRPVLCSVSSVHNAYLGSLLDPSSTSVSSGQTCAAISERGSHWKAVSQGHFGGDAGRSHHRSTVHRVLYSQPVLPRYHNIINLKSLARAVQTAVQDLYYYGTAASDILVVCSSDLVASHATAFSRQPNRFSDIARDLDHSQLIPWM